MAGRRSLGYLRSEAAGHQAALVVRISLVLGWLVSAAGYLGPWIGHPTAALTVSGADLGEFVKFLPDVLGGTVSVSRQIFYLPAVATVVGIALMVATRKLAYPWPLRVLALSLGVFLSLQLLPPAWSKASLGMPEFRLQLVALGICWLLLAGAWALGGLPVRAAGTVAGFFALAAAGLAGWQLALVWPAALDVYQTSISVGWGFVLCMSGLMLAACAHLLAAWIGPRRGRSRW